MIYDSQRDFTEVSEDTEIIEFDGIDAAAVYVGSLIDLKPAKIEWRREEGGEFGEDISVLTLKEIAEQIPDEVMITVIVEEPLGGVIYQYGNYGHTWWRIGKLMGYA